MSVHLSCDRCGKKVSTAFEPVPTDTPDKVLVLRAWVECPECIEKRPDHESALKQREAEIEQLQVQLAGCGVAALGGTSDPVVAARDSYGWSPTYQDVLELRRKYDDQGTAIKEREAEVAALAAALRGMVENATSLGASHPHLANYVHHPEEAWTAARAALADPPVAAMSGLIEAAREQARLAELCAATDNDDERNRLYEEWSSATDRTTDAVRACNLGGAK